MAEFVDVIRQFHRMCKSNAGCVICPLRGKEGCSINAFVNNPERIEGEVMSWAAEHPEPVYPTWTEYFRMIGVFPSWSGHEILDATHIPAETARKLGVEPKEGT